MTEQMTTKKSKILVVDDEPRNLKLLKIRLERNYEVMEAATGEICLEVLSTFRPAVILLDIMMPGIDGFQVLQELRKNPVHDRTKVILVSGRALVEDKLEGYKYGADDYVTKPFSGEELDAKVKAFVRLYNVETELFNLNSSLEEQVKLRSEQLLASEKLAFIGRHACEIVHNLRNPLTILKSHLSIVDKALPANESIVKMNRATDRVLEIVKDILSATGEQTAVVKEVDLNSVVSEELEILNLNKSGSLKIKREIHLESTARFMAAPTHAHQIIGNLLKNSFEAMHSQTEGHVVVRTEDFEKYTLLTIKDNGPGISPENLSKVFNPLFTTKNGENGGPLGNGLGLSYCKKMIESYRGSINIMSQPSQGTQVVVKFPSKPAIAKPQAAAA